MFGLKYFYPQRKICRITLIWPGLTKFILEFVGQYNDIPRSLSHLWGTILFNLKLKYALIGHSTLLKMHGQVKLKGKSYSHLKICIIT